jgi:hypothetical protein
VGADILGWAASEIKGPVDSARERTVGCRASPAPGDAGGPAERILKVDDASGAVTPFGDFLAFSPGSLGGVSVAAADVDGDGQAEVIVGAGSRGGPNVVIFKLAADGQATPFASLLPLRPRFPRRRQRRRVPGTDAREGPA